MAFNGTNRFVVQAGTLTAATVQATFGTRDVALGVVVSAASGTVTVAVQPVDASGVPIAQDVVSVVAAGVGGTVGYGTLGGMRQAQVAIGPVVGTVVGTITAQG